MNCHYPLSQTIISKDSLREYVLLPHLMNAETEMQVSLVAPANGRNTGSIPESGRSPGGGKWQPTPIFSPGKSHGQRNMVGYNPLGCKRIRHDLATRQQQPAIQGGKTAL